MRDPARVWLTGRGTRAMAGVLAGGFSGLISGAGSTSHTRISGLTDFCGGPPTPSGREPCSVTYVARLTLLGPNGHVVEVTRSSLSGRFSFAAAPGRYTLVARERDGHIIGRAPWNATTRKTGRVKIMDKDIL